MIYILKVSMFDDTKIKNVTNQIKSQSYTKFQNMRKVTSILVSRRDKI